MLVLNETGRTFEMTEEDFERSIQNGLKFTRLSSSPSPKKVVGSTQMYTAIAGKYPFKRDDIKCFGFDAIFKRSVMEAKRYKVLPHIFIEEDITIWTDANIFLKTDKNFLIENFLGDNDMALFKHPYRKTAYEEFATLRKDKRFDIAWLQEKLALQEKRYREEGFDGGQLYECNFIIRRNNERVNNLMNAWWAEICATQWRDQVSLPYVIWKYGGVKISEIEGNIRNNKFFKYVCIN
ncbi:MAG: DUF616 domain-containing protein [Actinobacteria bacterium]|nr:DUF616 domain-containing protein [Actinomycetota bacterium]